MTVHENFFGTTFTDLAMAHSIIEACIEGGDGSDTYAISCVGTYYRIGVYDSDDGFFHGYL